MRACWILLCTLVSLGLGGAACNDNTASSPGGAGGAIPVTLQLNWKPEPQFGGFYAARMNGDFAKRGLEVDIREGGASAPTIDMVAAGTVPFAIVSGDEIVIARARGKRVVGLFAVYQTHPQGIMTRASRGFTRLEQVFANPGTLGMEQGLGYSDFLERKYGFDQLKIVPTPFGDLSFIRNDENYSMQCFVTSEPIAAKKLGLDVTTFLIADAGYNPYATVLATSEEYLQKNRATVEAMVHAVRDGWRGYLADPLQTNEMMRRLNPTMDEETFAAASAAQVPLIETQETQARGLGSMSTARWAELSGQLASLGIIKQAPPAQACFVEFSPAAPDEPEEPHDLPSAEWTHTLRAEALYYLGTPQQGRPPEGSFPAGTRVKVLKSDGSHAHVQAEDGTTAWVASDSLKPN
jgi:NitT/TauT family transport system substrate-binding protein